jgi:ATP-binding cassette subfamily B protein
MMDGPGPRSDQPQPVDLDSALPRFLTSPGLFLSHYVCRWRGHFIALTLIVVAAASCAVAVQYAMKLLIDAMTTGPQAGRQSTIWTVLGFFIALIAAESLLWRLSGWIGCRTTIGAGIQMRLDLFDQLSGQPMRYFTENLAGSLGQRITATAGNFGALSNTVIWRVAPPTIDFLGAIIVLTTIHGSMASALGCFVIAITTGLILFGKRGRPLHQAFAARSGEVAGELTDTISNMWAVKAFTARLIERNRLEERFGVEGHVQRASWMYVEKTRLLYDVVLWLMAGGMLVWAISLWNAGVVTTGDVVLISSLTFRILHGARDLSLSLVDMAQQFGYIEDTLKIIAQRPTLTDKPDRRRLIVKSGTIEFRNISFAYGEPRGDAIHELNLRIEGGQKIGIVGPSGAGKSTLIALIQRLYDVQQGEILIDGVPIQSVTQKSLRAAVAVVPQEISLFHRSIMDNIRYGRPSATDEDVSAAARSAYCESFILALPDGYQTIVGERGTKLSGGQRQRIGIARAFLKCAPIIILDEATSALDTQSEIEVQRALVHLNKDRTVIAVAHRLSTVSAFDRIVVMKDGNIVEDGTAERLRSAGGVFAEMWHLQAEGLNRESAIA